MTHDENNNASLNMVNTLDTVNTVNVMPNGVLFEAVASRLKSLYRREHGMDFLYGCFEFIFHEGRFQGIEDRPRSKRYRSPARWTPSTTPGEKRGI